MTHTPTFAAIASMAFDAEEGYAILDGEIFHRLYKDDGSFWSNDFADDVWHRRDAQDPDGFEGPPPFSRNAETALSLRFKPYRHVLTELPRPDDAPYGWRPWRFEIDYTPLGETFIGEGNTAALAICNAIMHVHSALHNEEASQP